MQGSPKILDPCCGSKMMWLDKDNPAIVFGDIRSETITLTDRVLRVDPDMQMDFRDMPFADNTFRLVAFDPPHIVRAGPKSWLAAKYGKLSKTWQEDLEKGFAECFRVLEVGGVLVFKWNESMVRLKEVLALTPHKPLFGQVSGKSGLTHFLVFMKMEAL